MDGLNRDCMDGPIKHGGMLVEMIHGGWCGDVSVYLDLYCQYYSSDIQYSRTLSTHRILWTRIRCQEYLQSGRTGRRGLKRTTCARQELGQERDQNKQ